MTLEEAKALSIDLWSYLAAHPECKSKEETPYWDDVKDLTHNCPLCATVRCDACPIAHDAECKLYKSWLKDNTGLVAKEILLRITTWKV